MSNFTPIATGAAANAAIVNAPLYELDTAITALQSVGNINAARPWAVIGGTAQPTSSTAVLVTDHITHTGKLVRGATTITSTNADMETRGNLAVGNGNHAMTASGNGFAVGSQHTIGISGFATGTQNSATGQNSAAFGVSNQSLAPASFSSGGSHSIDAASSYATIAGGYDSGMISALGCGILAGTGNIINNTSYAAIGAGTTNYIAASSSYAFLSGGTGNGIESAAVGSFLGAGKSNLLKSVYGAIVSGESGLASGKPYEFIGSGYSNQINGTGSAIVNGTTNWIGTMSIGDSSYSFIGAGGQNRIQDTSTGAIVAGQANQLVSSSYSFIGAGNANIVTGAFYSSVVAGYNNKITVPSYAFIGAGSDNTISGSGPYSAIVAGQSATVTGSNSTVLNGLSNTISGQYAVAGGVYSQITHANTFMWNSTSTSVFSSSAVGEFAITSHGGVRFFTNTGRSTGMTLAAGASSWSAVSSEALKTNFKPVEQQAILAKLLTVPIRTYNYKDGDSYHPTINLGPTAEDWDGAFADILGRKTIALDGAEIPAINDGDKLGVALAAIQALTMEVNELKAKLAN